MGWRVPLRTVLLQCDLDHKISTSEPTSAPQELKQVVHHFGAPQHPAMTQPLGDH
jgi:hypothetical protein